MKDKKRRMAELFLTFLICAFLGWLYETILEVFVYHTGFSNRGILNGPYCPVYGFGFLLIYSTLHRFLDGKPWKERLKKLPLVFVLGAALSTLVELLVTYALEYTIHSWPWNYEHYAFDFQGRIALNPSIRFGILGVLILYLLVPTMDSLYRHLSKKQLLIISGVLLASLIVDVVATIVARTH